MNIHYEKEQESFKKSLQCNGEKTLAGLSIGADTIYVSFSQSLFSERALLANEFVANSGRTL